MQVLVLDDIVRSKISNLKEFADKFPVSTDQLKLMMSGDLNPIGDDPRHCIEIPHGYRVVYSIEFQPQNKVRHISISINKERYPSPDAVDAIIPLFGFSKIKDVKSHFYHVYQEPEVYAINIMEEIID